MKRLPRTLDPVELRVLGALLEKEQATPAYYPMTVNSLVQACNQKTNREPVMALAENEVQAALDRLFEEDVFAWRSRSGRTVKWKQNVDRRWELTPATKAVLTLLMLRGPQTVGELRQRADRLHAFDSLETVARALAALAEGDEPLVRELARQPGQKENRWAHLITGEPSEEVAAPAVAPAIASSESRFDRLEARVAALEERLTALEPRTRSESR